jgi:hypothetical protein
MKVKISSTSTDLKDNFPWKVRIYIYIYIIHWRILPKLNKEISKICFKYQENGGTNYILSH